MTAQEFKASLVSIFPSFLLSGAVLLLLVFASVLAWFLTRDISDPERATFNFIALVIIFMTALTIAASVFKGLSLSDPTEAFGLPSGSVRALLAIGVMILFVVFGLPIVSPDGSVPERLSEQPFRTLQIEASDVEKSMSTLRAQNFTVIVVDYGQVPAPPQAGQPPAAPRPAKLEIYAKTRTRPAQELDFSKQLLTALITLLTSIVSFYFGSRSVAEATRPADAGPSGSQAPLDVDIKRMKERLGVVDAEIEKVGKALDDLKAAEAPKDEAVAARRLDALNQVIPVRGDIEAKRDQLKRLLESAETKIAALGAAGPDQKSAFESEAREYLLKIASALAVLEQSLASYAQLVGAIYLIR